MKKEERYKANLKVQKLAIYVGILLLIIKFTAYIITDSNAILSDAMESIINVAASFIGLFSLNLTLSPKDKNHPYGHGKVEFISGLTEGLMIFIASIAIIYKGVDGFFNPGEIQSLDLGLVLIIFSGLVNYIVGFIAERQGERTNSMTLIAGGKHLKTDAYTTLGIVIGIALILITKLMWIDNAVALIFGLMILRSSYKILRRSIAGIMDEADFKALDDLAQSLEANRIPEWIDIHNLRLVKYGPDPHIDCHLTIPFYKDLKYANTQVKKLNEIVDQTMDTDAEMFVHIDPCIEEQCPICEVQECEFRKAPFSQRIEWNMDNVLHDGHHA